MGFFNSLLSGLVREVLYSQKRTCENVISDPERSAEEKRFAREKLEEVKSKLEQIRNYEDN